MSMKKRLGLFFTLLSFLLVCLGQVPIVEASSNYVNRISHFAAVNGEISLDGYSYVKGVAIPTQNDVIQKLKFVNTETGKQVLTFNISNFYSTAVTKDPNHGNNKVNYDWAKFKDVIDISSLPVGEYYIKLYTNAKGNAYDEIITFHSSITGFSFVNQQKQFNFVREGQTLKLKVTTDEASMADPHVKRISKFSVENGLLAYDGYSYIKGVHIPNQNDIIQKLKFVDTVSGKQVKTYQLNNYYSTAASKDPNHGNNVMNYDWAKFKGTLDISDLDYGEYYIKIYTNAKGNKYDEIINFHSSLQDFSYEANGKKFNFIREGSTFKLVVEQGTTGPIYTGVSVVNQLLSEEEEFYEGHQKNSAYWSSLGKYMAFPFVDVSVVALNGLENIDLSITVMPYDWNKCFIYTEKVLVKVIPSGATKIINFLKSAQQFQSGTWIFDGRTVEVKVVDTYAVIDISPKQ